MAERNSLTIILFPATFLAISAKTVKVVKTIGLFFLNLVEESLGAETIEQAEDRKKQDISKRDENDFFRDNFILNRKVGAINVVYLIINDLK